MASGKNTMAGGAMEAPSASLTAPGASNTHVLANSVRYIRAHWLRFSVISAVVLIPCFWHREIAADDLGSHLYNAWLVQLIHRGQAPGLWIAHPWTNVLFDYLLSGLGAAFGLHAGEKIAVAICVLIFFWGAFALVAAAARRAPWFLAPCIALAAYGWTFEMGLLNYYLSIGLAFFGVAIFWRGFGWERLIAIAIAPLALLASPLGLIFLIGACVYVWLAETAPRWLQVLWFAGAAAILVDAPKILRNFYPLDPPAKPSYFFNGADQLMLFGFRYAIIEYALIAFVPIAIAADIVTRRRQRGSWASYAIPVQLYALAIIAIRVLPDAIRFSNAAPAALLTERFTAISLSLAICALGAMRPRKWHLAATAAIAALFFAFLYRDTARINRMEAEAVQLVSKLPANQRVLGSILPLSGSRVLIQHTLDRACVGRCFSYGNYEPGSRDFRVRARIGNPYVITNYSLAVSTESGDYVVQPEDLPAYQIYECGDGGQRLCIAALRAGEPNDSMADGK